MLINVSYQFIHGYRLSIANSVIESVLICTDCCMNAPAASGLNMPAKLEKHWDMATSTPAIWGARSRWFICQPEAYYWKTLMNLKFLHTTTDQPQWPATTTSAADKALKTPPEDNIWAMSEWPCSQMDGEILPLVYGAWSNFINLEASLLITSFPYFEASKLSVSAL